MSRTSNDLIKDGRVYEGYDYRLQVWITNGLVDKCGHSPAVADCNGCRLQDTPIAVCEDAETFPSDQHVRVFILGPVEGRRDVCWHSMKCATCQSHQSFLLRITDLNTYLDDHDTAHFTYLTEDEIKTLTLNMCASCRHQLLIEELQTALAEDRNLLDASMSLIKLLTTSAGLFQHWLNREHDNLIFYSDQDDNPLAVYLRSYGLETARVSLPKQTIYTPITGTHGLGSWAKSYVEEILNSRYTSFDTTKARTLLQQVLQRSVYSLGFKRPPQHLLG